MTRETFSNGVYSQYGYDWASRLTSLNHKKSSDNSVILRYSATYDNANRLLTSTESPVAATTTYAYDDANRLTSEDRTGSNPYLSDYAYNADGQRATGFRSEDGVTSHDGTYTYDNADELTLVVEEASGSAVNENYTWYDDGTLKTYPGPGYTRLLDYDEEGRLASIKRDNGTTQTLAYEYAYGFDGGRRWRKDYDNNMWNWYPCGVACAAGELVVLQNSIGGSNWSALWRIVPALSGPFLSEGALLNGRNGWPILAIDGSGQTSASDVADRLGVYRYGGVANYHPWNGYLKYHDWDDPYRFLRPFLPRLSGPTGSCYTSYEYDKCADYSRVEACVGAGFGCWPVGVPAPFRGDDVTEGTFDYYMCTECCSQSFWSGEYMRQPNYSRAKCNRAEANCYSRCRDIRDLFTTGMCFKAIAAGRGFVFKAGQ
jgi:YD repeat-containing protein